ncbi:hypothetical protein SKAU_G00196390 [Synaphobranchus kaupii]|uniref:Uncharacterized protein n=1 Tax=Synaphobranchus kaupii TaxID=118154 RepID=A0A9Q1IXX5_SYNKA|nr:hypothetical protein SKAU_G00196390 [Synaphobranchus kaupii]
MSMLLSQVSDQLPLPRAHGGQPTPTVEVRSAEPSPPPMDPLEVVMVQQNAPTPTVESRFLLEGTLLWNSKSVSLSPLSNPLNTLTLDGNLLARVMHATIPLQLVLSTMSPFSF